LRPVSVKYLCELLEKDPRTVKDRITHLDIIKKEGPAFLYNSKEAIEAIYLGKRQSKEEVQNKLNEERARFEAARASKTELEYRKLNSELFDAQKVEQVWTDMVLAFRAKILAIPTKLAQAHHDKITKAEVQAYTSELVAEALEELKSYDPKQYGGIDREDSLETRTAPKVNSERVGRPRKKAKL